MWFCEPRIEAGLRRLTQSGGHLVINEYLGKETGQKQSRNRAKAKQKQGKKQRICDYILKPKNIEAKGIEMVG